MLFTVPLIFLFVKIKSGEVILALKYSEMSHGSLDFLKEGKYFAYGVGQDLLRNKWEEVVYSVPA